ncbi:MAG: phosphomethylpyrimidine synthase ThiC [Methanomicrobiales archaeon]|nr:phosphomethylpyrimidine synthase ThiC [Methanomicrobiales archaeon]
MCVMPSLPASCRTGVPELVVTAAGPEGIAPDRLAGDIARGWAVIPANPRRRHRISAIGAGCRVKVNVNIGTSGILCDPDLELEKARAALENGADTLMDLSTGGDLPAIRGRILSLDAPVGTVPVYEAVRRAGSAVDLEPDLLFRVIREHCHQGVDFLTLHTGVNLAALEALRADPRIMGVVSRGGVFHIARMVETGEENPLFSEFDYLMEILLEEEVVASLGDGMRPGCHHDAGRLAKTTEYLTLGRQARETLDRGVQRMVEGPGHLPLSQVSHNIRMMKELTGNAPLYLLGPLVTDIAPGYDHVAAAVGGAVACMDGADFLCMVSPGEHLALPSVDEIVEGTRVCRIAAHIGDTVRCTGKDWSERELAMAFARRDLDWEKQFETALYGGVARRIHERDGDLETCSMCGDLCAVKMVQDLLKKGGRG